MPGNTGLQHPILRTSAAENLILKVWLPDFLEKNITTAAMKFGLENEPAAAHSYAEVTGNNVYLSGFVVNPSFLHLGASPDSKIFDLNSRPVHGLLEIKCSMKE